MLLLLSRFSHVNSVQPHRRQPTRLLCPWDSPGKNAGVGCHFLLQCMHAGKVTAVVSDSATLWTAAHQTPPSTRFSRQEYWIGLPFSSPFTCNTGKYLRLYDGEPSKRALKLTSIANINQHEIIFRATKLEMRGKGQRR